MYLVAVVDWYSRKVLAWRISNTMEATFCVDCLEQALQDYGQPEIFNTDQGSQFTSDAFTGILKSTGITIPRRALDNIFVERLRLAARVVHQINGVFCVYQHRKTASIVAIQNA